MLAEHKKICLLPNRDYQVLVHHNYPTEQGYLNSHVRTTSPHPQSRVLVRRFRASPGECFEGSQGVRWVLGGP